MYVLLVHISCKSDCPEKPRDKNWIQCILGLYCLECVCACVCPDSVFFVQNVTELMDVKCGPVINGPNFIDNRAEHFLSHSTAAKSLTENLVASNSEFD